MDSYSETEHQFFDSRDESDSGSDCSELCSSSGREKFAFGYEFWTRNPESVVGRRSNFLKWMGLDLDWYKGDREEVKDLVQGIDRLRDNSEAVLANSDSEDGFSSARSFQSFQSNESGGLIEDGPVEEINSWKIKNLDDGTEFVVDELGKDGMLSLVREVGSNKTITIEEFHRILGSSTLVQQFFHKDSKIIDPKQKLKKGWLQKLSLITRKERAKGVNLKPCKIDSKATGNSTRKVRSHSYRKRSKELSLLQVGQEFPAHKGSILTMKFSPDGQYLASAGEDGIVRVWKVMEDEYANGISIQDTDSSCIYFSIDPFSKLAPLNYDKEKIAQMKKLRKSSESTCAILPPKIFRILEKPVHEFHGHKGDVLALSWSKNGYLLSSSVDKTVRLWQVGLDKCLGAYAHNNYVTCVDFNPVDDDYFISGSIDGKVRIWKVHDFRVIDWTDMREIVTAVCYSPDGKGGIVGSMDGNCRFYDIVDNHLQLGAQICLTGKKKLAGKRITGIQFCPSDVSKVMVSSADSQIRILSGPNVICKFKGMRSQASASFTADGKHVISTTEDSNVYVWNYTNQDQTSARIKNISAYESFLSGNAAIAIPWGGLKTKPGSLHGDILENGHFEEDLIPKMPSALPDCFTLGRGFFLDSLYKGSATWPEEKLPDPSPAAVSPSICKSEFKFLKSALQSALNSPHLWGLVIVTAGWDGCIKTFLNYGLPIRF